ncbi:hypothetical protein EYC84_001163 [Monilinia fructicola]|uniref:WW domain-containing protein n=1 Tax=Monilinia fructicola TaxID=38448 RepID=A0A5M9JRI6_MONFR|nr:hypothetical protein EYC84_001163 [Monilinia fructicola]
MEDEARSLPDGWIRQYDPELHHQFFVDTTHDPPRSIWHHPYDDEQYMSALTPIERRQIEGIHRVPSDADIEAESTDDDDAPAPPADRSAPPTRIHKLGRKVKDKLTSSTHAERAARRRQRERQEADAYRRHQALRRAMAEAARTGAPQLVGRDRNGKDVYLEPPFGAGFQRTPYARGGYGYNPFGAGVQGPFGPSPYGGWIAGMGGRRGRIAGRMRGGMVGDGGAAGDGVGWGVDVGGVDDLGWENDCGHDDDGDDDAVLKMGSRICACFRTEWI